jgi:hypothetical protein
MDIKYNKFRIYIATQICKFMLIFKEYLEKNNPIVGVKCLFIIIN